MYIGRHVAFVELRHGRSCAPSEGTPDDQSVNSPQGLPESSDMKKWTDGLVDRRDSVLSAGGGMEQRQSERFRVHLPIAFSGDLVEGDGLVVDISRGGCGVGSDQTARKGSFVHLLLYLPHHVAPIKIELAVVRWAIGEAFGLEFIRMSPQHQQHLRQFIDTLPSVPGSP